MINISVWQTESTNLPPQAGQAPVQPGDGEGGGDLHSREVSPDHKDRVHADRRSDIMNKHYLWLGLCRQLAK